MDIFSLDADGIRKMLDECRSDIAVIAARHPEVMEAFKNQYETDKKMYAKLPTFICVSTNAGLINTTIRYRDFLRVLPMFEQRPDLLDTNMGRELSRRRTIPLNQNSDSASAIFGMPPMSKK